MGVPYFINVSADAMESGALVFHIRPGKKAIIGSGNGCDIQLHGLGIGDNMCSVENRNGKIMLKNLKAHDPAKHTVSVDDFLIEDDPVEVSHDHKVALGHAAQVLKLIKPGEKVGEDHPMDQAHLGAHEHDVPDEHIISIKTLMPELQARLGNEQANAILEIFRQAFLLCDEANHMGEEMLGSELAALLNGMSNSH